MGLNGILYGFSLFSFNRQSKLQTKPAIMKNYDLKLCYLDDDGNPGKIKYHEQGTTEPPEAIIIDGFSEDRYIDLRNYWTEILEDKIAEFHTDITTYETIIKFGDTQQLVNEYKLVIKVIFS